MDKWSHEYRKFIKFHFIPIYIVAIYFFFFFTKKVLYESDERRVE